MPIYEYLCSKCQYISEWYEFYIESAPKERVCLRCGNIAKRIISRSSFELVGTGWPGKEIKNAK